jgi:hypothetical protein
MCDKKTSSIVHAQQASRERIAELMLTAEKELGAFYEAVFRRYGLKEAKKSAQDWIEHWRRWIGPLTRPSQTGIR